MTTRQDEYASRIQAIEALRDEGYEEGCIATAVTVLTEAYDYGLTMPLIGWHGMDAVVFAWNDAPYEHYVTITTGVIGYLGFHADIEDAIERVSSVQPPRLCSLNVKFPLDKRIA